MKAPTELNQRKAALKGLNSLALTGILVIVACAFFVITYSGIQ